MYVYSIWEYNFYDQEIIKLCFIEIFQSINYMNINISKYRYLLINEFTSVVDKKNMDKISLWPSLSEED